LTRFGELLRALAAANAEYIIVGGVAAAAHGSARATQDIDLVYRREEGNLQALALALGPLEPALRGAPPGLPFRFDVPTLRSGLNFTLSTRLGWLDLFGEISGGGTYEELLPHSIEVEVFGVRCRVLALDALIRVKRAAGRPKDFEAIAELELLRERG
jgi:predicted nucleotidyltransferase